MMPATARVEPLHTDTTQRVVIVGGDRDALEWLESALEPGRYEMLFVDEIGRAYSRIKEVSPTLVVLCSSLNDMGAFQLLTCLNLDEETRQIPVHTYTTEWDGQDSSDDATGATGDSPLASRPLPRN
jgi:PleD family two-component response regulator